MLGGMGAEEVIVVRSDAVVANKEHTAKIAAAALVESEDEANDAAQRVRAAYAAGGALLPAHLHLSLSATAAAHAAHAPALAPA